MSKKINERKRRKDLHELSTQLREKHLTSGVKADPKTCGGSEIVAVLMNPALKFVNDSPSKKWTRVIP